MVYRTLRCCGNPLVEYHGRPLPDIVFPILNTSQKLVRGNLAENPGTGGGRHGSWGKGLDIEKRFLVDSVKIDSTAFSLEMAPAWPPAIS